MHRRIKINFRRKIVHYDKFLKYSKTFERLRKTNKFLHKNFCINFYNSTHVRYWIKYKRERNYWHRNLKAKIHN